MNIIISGLPQYNYLKFNLNQYVNNKLVVVANKYFDNVKAPNVHFSKEEHNQFKCHIIVNPITKNHRIINSTGHSNNIFASFDLACTKLEQQLRRYKSKLKDNHGKTKLCQS
ncbi:ribosomal subunit interface protein [Orientia chuto str. Dubai]|uniref:Ribosomal subunit interface protein n=1 Tax=Orientia chuto str. Dubai TaxID=1359168 RepID=A0A0F3ML62_9RICK|nr:ribosome-associated translation inhibitor RaiA [Candidatus Orientia mediorientalis]KJV56187.1 ribosomal subunit interface protein [Orientia chuto str. Dubai]